MLFWSALCFTLSSFSLPVQLIWCCWRHQATFFADQPILTTSSSYLSSCPAGLTSILLLFIKLLSQIRKWVITPRGCLPWSISQHLYSHSLRRFPTAASYVAVLKWCRKGWGTSRDNNWYAYMQVFKSTPSPVHWTTLYLNNGWTARKYFLQIFTVKANIFHWMRCNGMLWFCKQNLNYTTSCTKCKNRSYSFTAQDHIFHYICPHLCLTPLSSRVHISSWLQLLSLSMEEQPVHMRFGETRITVTI